jgi:putative ABC transport system substrate-binding protein
MCADHSSTKRSLAEGARPLATRSVALSRRAFIVGVGVTLLTGCDLSFTGRPSRVPRIGHLSVNPLSTNEAGWQGFLEGLRENGWVDGRNVGIDWRDANGAADQLPALAAELAAVPVDVIVTGTVAGVMAATQPGSATPVVMMAVSDPVGSGLVPSLARPGGRVTGTASLAPQLTAKRIELLKEAMPGISRVAIFWNPANPAEATAFGEAQTAAKFLGLQLQSLHVRVAEDFPAAFRAVDQDRAEALVDGGGPLLANSRKRILEFATAKGLPVIGRGRPWVEDGALMSYGGNATDQWRRSASFADKILRGTKPADLPIELPTTFELVVNLRTAETLRISFGRSFSDQVTEALR